MAYCETHKEEFDISDGCPNCRFSKKELDAIAELAKRKQVQGQKGRGSKALLLLGAIAVSTVISGCSVSYEGAKTSAPLEELDSLGEVYVEPEVGEIEILEPQSVGEVIVLMAKKEELQQGIPTGTTSGGSNGATRPRRRRG